HRPRAQRRPQHEVGSSRRGRERAAADPEVAGRGLLPAHRRGARIMIGIIKAEWRKLAWRPANLVAIGGLLAVVALMYWVGYIEYTWPAASQAARAALLKQGLYPGGLVKNLMNGVMPLGAAMTLVLGGLATGSEYGWGTLRTVLTQGPGRIQTWVAKMAGTGLGVGVVAALVYGAGASSRPIGAGVRGDTNGWQ